MTLSSTLLARADEVIEYSRALAHICLLHLLTTGYGTQRPSRQ
jgi:hypothetical protein